MKGKLDKRKTIVKQTMNYIDYIASCKGASFQERLEKVYEILELIKK